MAYYVLCMVFPDGSLYMDLLVGIPRVFYLASFVHLVLYFIGVQIGDPLVYMLFLIPAVLVEIYASIVLFDNEQEMREWRILVETHRKRYGIAPLIVRTALYYIFSIAAFLGSLSLL